MSFSFGQSGNNYSSSYQGTEAIAPENTGIGWLAQRRLNNVVGRANQRLINALRVDGVPLTFWMKTQTGYPCTCCKPGGSTSGLLASAVNDVPSTNNFYTDTESINLPDPTEQKFKVIRVRGTNLVEDLTEDVWSNFTPTNIKTTSPEITETFPLNAIEVNLDNVQDIDVGTGNINEFMGQQEDGDFELDNFFAGGDSGAVFGGDKTACGICFTSGWTQGYSLVNGKRIILDASGEVPFSLQGADLVSSVFPNAFKLPVNNTGVYWKIELPVFCQQWVNIRARNNLKPAQNVIIEYTTSITEPNWQLLTLDVLNSTSNSATRVWYIRARRDPGSRQYPEVLLTHIELMVITSDPVPSQTPNFSYNTDFNQYDAIINTTFDVAPTISMIPRESVFTDNKYGLCWKVTEVTPQMTSAQQIFGFTVNARVIQRHEMLYNLHNLYVEVPSYLQVTGASGQTLQEYNSTVPNQFNEIASVATNFEDLQQIQGGYATVNFEEQEYGQQVDNILPDDSQPLTFIEVQVPEILIPMETHDGLILTAGLHNDFKYESPLPSAIVITFYPTNVQSTIAFTASGTFYPLGANVQVGYSNNLDTPPTFWQDATTTNLNWATQIAMPSTGAYILWARRIYTTTSQTVVGFIIAS